MSENEKWGTPEFHRAHPIFYKPEDMTKTKEELIKKIRTDLSRLRGQLHDIKFGFGWGDRLEIAEHGLTLVISYLYGVLEEMEKPTP